MQFRVSAAGQQPPPLHQAVQAAPTQSITGTLTKQLLSDGQAAVLELMRRSQSPLQLESLNGTPESSAAENEMRQAIGQVVGKAHPHMAPKERLAVIEALLHEMRGFGPLEPLLQRRTEFEEIEVNRPDRVYVVRKGGAVELLENVRFRDDEHVRFVAQRLLATVRRRVTDAEPMVDASLPGGIRINVIAAPVACDGTAITIRLHHAFQSATDLVANGTLTHEAMNVLATLVAGRISILLVGGTGTGKTTLLNLLCSYIPALDRIITVEDAAELQIRDGNVVRLETRPPNIEGKGEITIRHLVRNALRQRPEWIIVGEMRGAEALDVLTAANSGHGVLSTLHANNAEAGMTKLITYASMSDEGLNEAGLAQQVVQAFPCVVHVERVGNQRRVSQIAEVVGWDAQAQRIIMRNIFVTRGGRLVPTGIVPERWNEALEQVNLQPAAGSGGDLR